MVSYARSLYPSMMMLRDGGIFKMWDQLDMVVCACNPNTWEAEAGGLEV
jgi:hypothetical protein